MKICIWCSKSENTIPFNNDAHSVPQNLGGKKICLNVCDSCNSYFGSYENKLIPIETVLKEAFSISRAFLLGKDRIGKNKPLPRFTSTFFNFNPTTMSFSLKPQFKLQSHFQKNLARQLKKGIYKIYLEELERQHGNAHDDKYNFIREFSRYNLGDYPLFYFERSMGILFVNNDWIESPEIYMTETPPMKYLVNEPMFFEFELLGHVFGIATARNWQIGYHSYLKESIKSKKTFFKSMQPIESFNQIDITMSFMKG